MFLGGNYFSVVNVGFGSLGMIRCGKSIMMSCNLGMMCKVKEEKWKEM